MKTRKWTALIAAGIMSVCVLASCTTVQKSADNTPAQTEMLTETATQAEITTQAETAAQIDTAVTTEAAVQTQDYRGAYNAKLAEMRAQYGTPKHKDFQYEKGVTFADLVDWDADGTPEMIVLVYEGIVRDRDSFRLSVFDEQDGKAVSLLETPVGSTYGDLSSNLYFALIKGTDGNLVLSVDDSHEYADLKETFYTLSDGKVQSTVLSAQSSVGGWEGEDDDVRPVDPDAFQIDGKSCSKADLDTREKELYGDDVFGVICQHNYDMQALDAFLSGKSDTYAGGALVQADALGWEPSTCLRDMMFTVGA